MALPDFTTYDDTELDEARLALAIECERRQRLATAPAQVAQIAQRFTEDGGDKADLVAALDGAPAPE